MRPQWQLAGVKRVAELAPGASATVVFELNARSLSVVYADGRRYVEHGRAILRVGGSSPVRASSCFDAAFACCSAVAASFGVRKAPHFLIAATLRMLCCRRAWGRRGFRARRWGSLGRTR